MMPQKQTKNLAASVRQRLLNIAKDQGEPFDLLLTQYGLERMLYRISVSEWAGQFLLKGALLFNLWHQVPRPSTRDADLLSYGPAETARLVEVFRALCSIDVEEDGLILDPESVRAQEIRENNLYQGVRVRLTGDLDGARVPVQFDVGFGDVVTPEPDQIEFPTLLEFPKPRMKAYPVYTVIAEKLQALVVLGIANSRMKDYYDLWALSENMGLELGPLRDAVAATFERRNTEVPGELPAGLTKEFSADEAKLRQWAGFVSKNRLDGSELTLEKVVDALGVFLSIPMEAARSVSIPDIELDFWPPGGPWRKRSS